MKGAWCYFKSYLNKEMCERIIQDAATIPFQDAVVGMGSDGRVDTSIRKSKIKFISNKDWKFDYLFDVLWKTAIMANRDFFDIHISRLEYVQLAEYDASYKGEYKEHHDVFWLNDDPQYHRKLSCIIQLSDPATYEGGKFEITEAPPLDEETNAQGTIVYFPSVLKHKANPVIRGTRYSIAAWFEGPKWR